ncbi:MAG: ATP-binding protein [Candidatus Omnitrophota bacterium]
MTIRLDIFNYHHYTFNPYFTPPFLVACLVLCLGFFILSLEKKSPLNRSFLYFCLSTALYLLGQSFVLCTKFFPAILFWSHVMYTGLIFMSVTIFHVSVAHTDRFDWEKRSVILLYCLALLLWILLLGGRCMTGFRQYPCGYCVDAPCILSVLLVFLLLALTLGIINLISYYRYATTRRAQKRTVNLMVIFVFAGLSSVDVLQSYGIKIYPLGYVAILCVVFGITYSIVKYHALMSERYAKELKREVDKKTQELSQTIAQLKATQVRLLETGKISAMASLSAGILHQITQPITAIHGLVKFMRKEMKETDPFLKPVKIMDEQTAYLKDMLEDLMELIRHRQIKKGTVDVNFCLKKTLELLADELRIRRVDLQVTMADHLPPVYADAIHLQQIFMNIVVNAIQALGTLPKGETRRLLIVSRIDRNDGQIMVAFKDTAGGLSEEDRQSIFEPFFSTKTKGSGIGLALCEDLIAEHGGTIDVQNKLGEGATFIVKLPPKKE